MSDTARPPKAVEHHSTTPAWRRRRRRRRVPSRGLGQLGQEAAIRALDIMVSLFVLIVFGWLLAFLCLVVRSTSRGPALFRQDRLGHRKRMFTVLKLRTMYADNDDRIHREYVKDLLTSDEPSTGGRRGLFKLECDPRVTPVGRWLRKSSMDELPQLFNVLRGEMSLVGPRPALAWEAELFSAAQQKRFDVRPGITGLWQVSGRSKLSFQEALDLDAEYVRRRSLLLNLKILLLTLPALFMGGAA
jgi:lipopolysaccharide/colanic/teichoic acid biosynthesis glycosyltransferase